MHYVRISVFDKYVYIHVYMYFVKFHVRNVRTVCRDPFSRFSRITSLLMEAERQLDHIKCELIAQNMSNSSAVKDLQRRLRRWQLKENLFSKMKNNYEEASELKRIDKNVHVHTTYWSSELSLSTRTILMSGEARLARLTTCTCTYRN